MVFSSIIFLCYFLPVTLVLYYALPRIRNEVLLCASLVFYAWGELVFLPVLAVSVAINYYVGALLQSKRKRRAYLVVGLLANLTLLGVFKYITFLDANVYALFGYHIPCASKFSRIPLGISFFTFQAMSYLVDVYRMDRTAEHRFRTVALYIIMFPQLIAGPIVRFKDIAHDIHSRTVKLDRIASGIKLFVLGLASKVLIANTLAVPADAAFGVEQSLGAGLAWLGLVCYSLQIYFDFAGYSWMAIGLGRMLGFSFPENFNLPYLSQSVTEFWRRWHISLSTWFRDYLYIPLGGNRHGALRTYRNLSITFLVFGLWHGASWNFVLWGAYHGAFLIAERIVGKRPCSPPWVLRHLYALLAVAGGWVLFRCESLAHVSSFLASLFSLGSPIGANRTALEFLSPEVIIALLVGIPVSGALGLPRFQNGRFFGKGLVQCMHWVRAVLVGVLLILCLGALASGTHNPFIYFNF
jgi:alginate O-acetyltransferase complex protein AlgI